LKRAGFADDEAFVSDFLKYREIEQKARELQLKGMGLYVSQIPSVPEPAPNEWQFYPISIYAPQHVMPIIDNILKADAEAGSGLFSNVTDIPEEDEGLDEFLMIEAFGLKCSLIPFLDELKRFGVVGEFFNKDITQSLFAVLKREAEFIKGNTDAPAKVENHIGNTIKTFDGIPIYGLFFQILILQGLCRWLEGVNLNEGDNGYDEALSLHGWLCSHLMEKELSFCYTPYGETDKEILKPLCDYLYSTEIGKLIQTKLFGNNPQLNVIGENPPLDTKKEDTVKPQRTINVEKLKGYFKSTFKGMGNGNIDYFSWLIGHLKINRNEKEFAQIALMIYDSGKMNNTKPCTFREWYRIFCDCVGCEYKSYDKNKLRNPREDIKNVFNYL
jgi:hypothetical protein